MVNISRVRVAMTGLSGMPGVSTFYFLDTATAVGSLQTLFAGLAPYIPGGGFIQVEPTGDTIDDVTGVLTGSWSSTGEAAIPTTGPTTHAAPVGALIGWETGVIMDGRRLRGKTFVVPLSTAAFQASGNVASEPQTTFATLAAGFVAEQSSSFVVWHRPRAAKAADGSRKAVLKRDGGHALVTSVRVPPKAMVLRSRRD